MQTTISAIKVGTSVKPGPKIPTDFPKQLELLWQIQLIDSEVATLLRARQTRPAVIERLRGEIASYHAIVATESALLVDIKKKLRGNEAELAGEKENLRQLQAKKKKPVRCVQTDHIQARVFGLETACLELTNERARVSQNLGGRQGEILKAQNELRGQEKLAADDGDCLNARLHKFSKQRARHLSGLLEHLYAHYDQLIKTRGGVGIVALRNQHCSGCNMLLPAQVYLEVRKEKGLMACTSCQRILCWRPDAGAKASR